MGKKYRERKEQEAQQSWRTRAAKGLVWKIFRFAVKCAYVLAFFFYLLMGTTMTYGWLVIKWTRHYPPEHIEVVAKNELLGKDPDPEKVRAWFQYRETKDCRILMDKLDPYTPHLPSTIFFLYSSCAANEGKMEEALNWRQYGRFRARFDALRCGSNDAPENFNDMIDMTSRDDIQNLMRKNPSLQPQSIRWALEFDGKHPIPDNDPTEVCRQLTALERGRFFLVDRKEWPGIHYTLRALSEYFAMLMEDNIKRGGMGIIDMPSLKVPREELQQALDQAAKEVREQQAKERAEKRKQRENK